MALTDKEWGLKFLGMPVIENANLPMRYKISYRRVPGGYKWRWLVTEEVRTPIYEAYFIANIGLVVRPEMNAMIRNCIP